MLQLGNGSLSHPRRLAAVTNKIVCGILADEKKANEMLPLGRTDVLPTTAKLLCSVLALRGYISSQHMSYLGSLSLK